MHGVSTQDGRTPKLMISGPFLIENALYRLKNVLSKCGTWET